MLIHVALALACKPAIPQHLSVRWSSRCLAIEQAGETTTDTGDTGLPPTEGDESFQPYQGGYTLVFTNTCDGPIDLVHDSCEEASCLFDLTLDAGETWTTELPAQPDWEEVAHAVTILEGDDEGWLSIQNEGGKPYECQERGLLGCQVAPAPTVAAWLSRRR